MSCVPGAAIFRLLDAYVGWDEAEAKHLAGLGDPAGLTLQPLAAHVDAAAIAMAIPPAWLARGCRPCHWYLVTCCPPASRLLELDPCTEGWRALHGGRCAAETLICATAIAVDRDRIAVSDPGAGRIWVWRRGGAELAFAIAMKKPGALAWAPWHGWLVTDLAAQALHFFDPTGAETDAPMPLPGIPDRLAAGKDCKIWLVTHDDGVYRIWSAMRGENFAPATLDDLRQAFGDTGLRHADRHHVCFADRTDGETRLRCFDCHGRPAEPPAKPSPPLYRSHGQLLTYAIDSGLPRCRWHRLRIDADVPPGTAIAVAVSSHEDDKPASQGVAAAGEWQGFAPGLPHPGDWQEGPQGAHDFLIDQPPGRYLFLRLRLSGDGRQTPRLRRIHLDFPRRTSFDFLPAVYRDNPGAEDFGERFLALFDAAIADIDRAIERYPALLDAEGVPPELLSWLGSFLGVALDPGWTAEQSRAVLKAVPELYRRRGTVAGLRQALDTVLGIDPMITERARNRPWGAVGQSRLAGVRLFGQSAARLRLGRSALSAAPLWSFGDPDLDALNSGAYRFGVRLPALAGPELRGQAAEIVEALKPAHTVADIHHGGLLGIIAGAGSSIGIDTVLAPLPAPVLGGEAGVRLSRASVLWAGRDAMPAAIRIGRASAVGIHTIME